MNCLSTRRTLLSDPHAISTVLSAHLAHCDACRQFAHRLACDETLLHAAMSVTPPEQLAERILLRTKLRLRQPRWYRWMDAWTQPHRVAYATAASLLLVLSAWLAVPTSETAQWSEVVLSHVIGEHSALTTNTSIAPQAMNQALKEYGLSLNASLGTLSYFDHCALPGGRGIHAVIDTPDLGKLTLILPPRGVRASLGEATREGYTAQIVQIGQASVGLVADRPENLAHFLQRLRAQLVVNM